MGTVPEQGKTVEILELASQLVRIPSVTVGEHTRVSEVHKAKLFITQYLQSNGLEVRIFEGEYPAILAGFPGGILAPVMLCGHLDVVAPEPDDRQFEPCIQGDYLWGRGTADMKTVLATYLVWFKDIVWLGQPYPPINLLILGNEETGEGEPMGTPFVLEKLDNEENYEPQLLIAGERTGERGDEVWGDICVKNRGVMRFQVVARGSKGHSAFAGDELPLSERIMSAQNKIRKLLQYRLTLESPEGWHSTYSIPFVQLGTPGVYNITPEEGRFGVEIRTLPQEDLDQLSVELDGICRSMGLEIENLVIEPGIECDLNHPVLRILCTAFEDVSGRKPKISGKLAGTSARFAPGGRGIVWGQSGVGPHSQDERHFIPSIIPYYQVLGSFADLLLNE